MLTLPSSALRPLSTYHPIMDGKEQNSKLSAPFDIVKVKLETKNLTVCVKAKDSQKSHYLFFNLQTHNGVAELQMRRRISKFDGKPKEQDFLLDVSKIAVFNQPLTLRLFRRTTKGLKLIHETSLNP